MLLALVGLQLASARLAGTAITEGAVIVGPGKPWHPEPPPAFVADLDAKAHERDIAGVRRYYAPAVLQLPRDPMAVLRGNGAYGAGKYGWHVLPLTPPGSGSTYVVFSTPLTMEDIGERLFEVQNDKLVRYVNELESGNWRIKRHVFHISFKPAKKEAHLTDKLTLMHSGAAKDEVFLRFAPNYKVSLVQDLDSGKSVKFAQAGGVLALGHLTGSIRHLLLRYSAIVNLPNYGGIITNRYAMLTDEYWYPMIARQPASYEATVEVPKGWSVVAQGELAGHTVGKTGETWMYRMDLPVTFFSLSAGAYHTFEQKIGGRTFRTWSFQMTPEESRWQAVMYSDILKTYDVFAKFAFTGYGAVDQPNLGDGMLEAYSFNTGQQGSYPADEPHEPSHTWFGGMIGNTYLKSFWNESFANYCEGYCRRNMAIGNRSERQQAFVQVPDVSVAYNMAPLNDAPADIGPAASALGYGKGASVLQMLEDEIGTPAMVAALRKWLAVTPRGALGDWGEFEKVVGPQFEWFFDEWVKTPGFADFAVSELGYSNGAVTGRLKFTTQPYRIHLQVLLGFLDGTRQFVRIDTTALPDSDGFRFSIPCARKPVLVSFDPWLKVLRPIDANERPMNASTAVAVLKHVRDAAHPEYLSFFEGNPPPTGLFSVDGSLLIGHPETMPAMRSLCKQAGFSVAGDSLTYKGTTIDLRRGGALAVLLLPGGRFTAIGLGNVHLAPETGNAQICLFDEYGRFLRGETAPKTSGNLTYRL